MLYKKIVLLSTQLYVIYIPICVMNTEQREFGWKWRPLSAEEIETEEIEESDNTRQIKTTTRTHRPKHWIN